MRILFAFCVLLVISNACDAQRRTAQEPFPTEVVVGRDSFIDVGPPFDYYDLTFLRSQGESTDVERVSLTPAADACYPRAEIKVAHVIVRESLSSLLQSTNPCTIPEKKLKAELKRRKKGLPVFSGMNVTMQVECTGGIRLIRADILDRDIFDQHPKTPQYTAWSQSIFGKLDEATGDRPWDTPILTVSNNGSPAPPTPQSPVLQAIADGKYDTIFGKDSDRPSELYRLAQNVPRQPFIELTKSDPVRPTTYVDPTYPPIAKAARVHGTVDFHLVVANDGIANGVTIDSGPKMLWQAATDAIAKWKFSEDDSGKMVSGSIRFGLNCAADSK